MTPNEDDISAEEEIEIQGTWLPRKNEYAGWQKGTCGKTQKRQKSIISIKGHNQVTFSSHVYGITKEER